MPKFASPLAKAQIDQLMQPALIRVIDNIRKQLDETAWQGNYEEELIWPDGTTDAQKLDYATLQKQLHGVPTETHDRVEDLMSQLPQPAPLYTLRLTKADSAAQTVDIWALCYQVCAVDYSSNAEEDRPLEADARLLDEQGEVDWRLLDDKTKALIAEIFQALPA